jgi:hypothetical protein
MSPSFGTVLVVAVRRAVWEQPALFLMILGSCAWEAQLAYMFSCSLRLLAPLSVLLWVVTQNVIKLAFQRLRV